MVAKNLMSNMIPGADGGSITPEQKTMLGYFKYNPVTDRIEATKPLSTTIHSLYFGDVHSMSSSYTNVLWTNQETMINYQAAGTALGPHKEENGKWIQNQPSTRYYFEYQEREPGGPVGDGSVLFEYDFLQYAVPANTSNWGHSWVAGEAYSGELNYRITTIPDDRLIVSRFYDVDVQPGELVTQLFDTPVDYYQGSYIHFELLKADGTHMKLYSNADENRFWVGVHFRGFTDKYLPYETQLSDLELAMSREPGFDDYIQEIDGQYIVDSDGHFIEWPSAGEGGRIGDEVVIAINNTETAFVDAGWSVHLNGSAHTMYGSANSGISLENGGKITFEHVGEYILEFHMIFQQMDLPLTNSITLPESLQSSPNADLYIIAPGHWYSGEKDPSVATLQNVGIFHLNVTASGGSTKPKWHSDVGLFTVNSSSSYIKIKRIA